MIVFGFARGDLATEFGLAHRLGASCLEILPDWRSDPSPAGLAEEAAGEGLRIHSIHASWGGQCRGAGRVDLGSVDERVWRLSLDELRGCADWASSVGAGVMVVHPGGLSDPAEFDLRRGRLADGLLALADHVAGGSGPLVCVENMPPGVHPGTAMSDLFDLVAELDRPELALALDTGHAHQHSTPAIQTLAAGRLLGTTHVHDNNGRQDSHLVPGHGTIDWGAWREALDAVGYGGPVMLECIRQLREDPSRIDGRLAEILNGLTGCRDENPGIL
jgi:sugar phosphate isomerase/epimerase